MMIDKHEMNSTMYLPRTKCSSKFYNKMDETESVTLIFTD